MARKMMSSFVDVIDSQKTHSRIFKISSHDYSKSQNPEYNINTRKKNQKFQFE